MLSIHSLKKSYKKTILDQITIDFFPTGVTVIVGLNGSGKTTLLDCLATIRSIDAGTVSINGHPQNSIEYRSQLFYVPSDFYLPLYMTGSEYLHFVLSRYKNSNQKSIPTLLEVFDLKDVQNNLLESYSYGMKKKIQLIAAVLSNTQYILGDELFSGLDLETILLALALIEKKAQTTGIILVSHNKFIIERFSNHILLMRNGQLTHLEGGIDTLEQTVLNMEVVHEKIGTIQNDQTLI